MGPIRVATTLSITTLSITTLSIMSLFVTLNINHTHHNDTQHSTIEGQVLLCWVSLCWVSLCRMSSCRVSWRPITACIGQLWKVKHKCINSYRICHKTYTDKPTDADDNTNVNPLNHRYLRKIDWLMEHNACPVCLISTLSGCNTKKKKNLKMQS